jgi:transcriptional antiterminator NusG
MAKEWYVIRVQSGREDLVRDTLDKRVKAAGFENRIARVLVPTEKVSEIKGGRKRVRERKLYPGYIMVEMEFDEQVWYLIRETPGIGDFVGSRSKPAPMAAHEAERILHDMAKEEEKPKLRIEFQKGDNVKIKEGPFENFDGMVEEVIPGKGLVKVVVTIFGRPTPVELEYWQIEAI